MVDYSYRLLGKQGALGNQLWEIAATLVAAKRGKGKAYFPDWHYQRFFNVKAEFGPEIPDDVEDMGDGYFQDWTGWWGHEILVGDAFSPSDVGKQMVKAFYAGVPLDECNVVHVRRGNNLTEQYRSHHPVCPLGYYEEALDGITGPLLVLSDDIPWCKQQEVFHGAHFGLGPSRDIPIMDLTKYDPTPDDFAAIDLLAMSECGGRVVMSNSSFSWWGAWLAYAEDVRYPAVWYGEPLRHIDTSVMFTDLPWTRVEFNPSWS